MNQSLPQSCCRFCGMPGHNILTCNDPYTVTIQGQINQLVNDRVVESVDYFMQNLHYNPVLRANFLIQTRLLFSNRLDLFTAADIAILSRNRALQTSTSKRYQITLLIDVYTLEVANKTRSFLSMLRGGTVMPIRTWTVDTMMLCTESAEELKIKEECSICYESHAQLDQIVLNCGHNFCHTCTAMVLDKQPATTKPTCALCREPINSIAIRCVELYGEFQKKTYIKKN